MSRLPLRRQRGGSDRAAVLVELALVAPLLISLVFGIFEFGIAWRADMTIGNAVRAGARVGSNAATDPLADHSSLVALGSALSDDMLDNINYVVVYRSTTSGGAVPSQCITASAITNGGFSSGGVQCNTYDQADLQAVVANPATSESSFGQGTVCTGGKDVRWCPMGRENDQLTGADYLGVAVSIDHDLVTGLFGSEMTITDHGIMRLEPAGSGGALAAP